MRSELHIGVDTEKTVVAPYPLRARSGRISRHRAGSVIETVPAQPSGVSHQARLAFAARLSLPLAFLCAVLQATGVPWWLPALASVATVAGVWRRQARAAQVASFAMPRGEDGRVLFSAEERAVFRRAVGVARRIRRTWPGLPGMIDPDLADRSLRRALDDLAGLLVRRQEIRRLRAELDGVRRHDVPADSPAVRSLAEQRTHAERLWRETGEQANRILRSLDRTALAGEAFLHEQHIGATARQAELVLAELAPGRVVADTGPELADRTAAVITAYRELAAADPR